MYREAYRVIAPKSKNSRGMRRGNNEPEQQCVSERSHASRPGRPRQSFCRGRFKRMQALLTQSDEGSAIRNHRLKLRAVISSVNALRGVA